MPRFFKNSSELADGQVSFTGEDAEHLKVLRLKPGALVTVCDGKGIDYCCELISLERGFATAVITGQIPSPGEPSVACTVLCGFPKSAKADLIVQKCTEAGAVSFVFFESARCVSKPDARSLAGKLERWQRIAVEAAKQSGRGIVPQVSAVSSFRESLKVAAESELAILLYETGERIALKTALESRPSFKSAALMTGPEGGFEPEEAAMAAEAGLLICSMGTRILRCETAPLVALTAVMYQSDNLG